MSFSLVKFLDVNALIMLVRAFFGFNPLQSPRPLFLDGYVRFLELRFKGIWLRRVVQFLEEIVLVLTKEGSNLYSHGIA